MSNPTIWRAPAAKAPPCRVGACERHRSRRNFGRAFAAGPGSGRCGLVGTLPTITRCETSALADTRSILSLEEDVVGTERSSRLPPWGARGARIPRRPDRMIRRILGSRVRFVQEPQSPRVDAAVDGTLLRADRSRPIFADARSPSRRRRASTWLGLLPLIGGGPAPAAPASNVAA